jgi:hypothetical protein
VHDEVIIDADENLLNEILAMRRTDPVGAGLPLKGDGFRRPMVQ